MQLSAGASIEVLDVSPADRRLQIDVNTTSPVVLSGKEIVLHLPEAYQGHLTYDARVKDASNAFSMQLTLNIYVLVNPCVHGRCEPRSDAGSCDHPQRSLTFDPYFCLCDPGYEGVWCQTETDECKTATCSPITRLRGPHQRLPLRPQPGEAGRHHPVQRDHRRPSLLSVSGG